jgi:hypothetical protein
VLVFDQFEEIFTLQSHQARQSIARQIGELVGGGVPQRIRQVLLAQRKKDENGVGYSEKPPTLKLVISLREDYVGALQELFPEVPSILSNRVRLTPLNKEQAYAAVVEPAGLEHEHFRTRPLTVSGRVWANAPSWRVASGLTISGNKPKQNDNWPYRLRV